LDEQPLCLFCHGLVSKDQKLIVHLTNKPRLLAKIRGKQRIGFGERNLRHLRRAALDWQIEG
jgi:hypothetical protein